MVFIKPSHSIFSLFPALRRLLLFSLVPGFRQKFSVLMLSHFFSSLFNYAAQRNHPLCFVNGLIPL